MRSISLVIALLAGALGVGLSAQKLPDPADASLSQGERLEALIERMKLEQRGVETMQAAFTQVTSTELLLEPETSRGVFYYQAPDKVRWEYLEPTPKVILINGEELLTWYQDLGRAERRHVGKYSDAVFKYLGASGSLEALRDYFDLAVTWPASAEEAYRVQLEPKYARVEKRLKEMSVAIDPRLYMPVELTYLEPTGDSTDYVFSEFLINEDVADDRFELTLPDDVQVRVVNDSGS
jgi:outer membrane lipoprotein carrier protein